MSGDAFWELNFDECIDFTDEFSVDWLFLLAFLFAELFVKLFLNWRLNLFSFSRKLSKFNLFRNPFRSNPEVWIANKIIMIPPIISTVRLFVNRNFPVEPITAPKSMNTTEKPATKRMAWRRVLNIWFLLFEGDVVGWGTAFVAAWVGFDFDDFVGVTVFDDASAEVNVTVFNDVSDDVTVPLMYAKYAGINGSMHGESIDRIPPKKAIRIVGSMFLSYFLFLFFSI